MAISKKFQHGDIIIHETELDLGRVIMGHKLIGGKWQRAYKDAIRNAIHQNNHDDTWVIVDWFEPQTIDWMYEECVRLATKAEIVLYGRKKV